MMAANQDLIGEEEQSLQLNKDAAVSKLAKTDGDDVEINEKTRLRAVVPTGDADTNQSPTISKDIVHDSKSKFSATTGYLGFCSFAFIIGSSFLYGYNVGSLNTPANVINETFYVVTYSRRRGQTPETADESIGDLTIALWQVTIALFVAGGAVGSVGQFLVNLVVW